MKLNLSMSQWVVQLFGREEGKCWANAFAALNVMPAACYVEGFVVAGPLIFEHGWLAWNGEIVDPTFYDHPLQPIMRYFPGVHYPRKDALRLLAQTGNHLPLALYLPECGRENPGYVGAWEKAEDWLRQLSAALPAL